MNDILNNNQIIETEPEQMQPTTEDKAIIKNECAMSNDDIVINNDENKSISNSITSNSTEYIDEFKNLTFYDLNNKDSENKEKEEDKFKIITNESIKILFEHPYLKDKISFNESKDNIKTIYSYINTVVNEDNIDNDDIQKLINASLQIMNEIEEKNNAKICPYQLIIGAIRRKIKAKIEEYNKKNPNDVLHYTDFFKKYKWGKGKSTLFNWEHASKIFDHGNYEKYYRYGYVYIGKLVSVLEKIEAEKLNNIPNKDLLKNIEKLRNLFGVDGNFEEDTRFVNFLITMIDLKDYTIDLELYKKLYESGYEFKKNDIENIKSKSYIIDIANIYIKLLLKTNGDSKLINEKLNELPKPPNGVEISLKDAFEQYKNSINKNNTSLTTAINTSDQHRIEQNSSINYEDQSSNTTLIDNGENKGISDKESKENLNSSIREGSISQEEINVQAQEQTDQEIRENLEKETKHLSDEQSINTQDQSVSQIISNQSSEIEENSSINYEDQSSSTTLTDNGENKGTSDDESKESFQRLDEENLNSSIREESISQEEINIQAQEQTDQEIREALQKESNQQNQQETNQPFEEQSIKFQDQSVLNIISDQGYQKEKRKKELNYIFLITELKRFLSKYNLDLKNESDEIKETTKVVNFKLTEAINKLKK